MSEHETNRRAWDSMVNRRGRFARPVTDDDFQKPLRAFATTGWLDHVRGKRLLCLGAGGGRLGPIYAAAGADVTVVDISGAQLELDREVARERRLSLRTVQTSMDDLAMFAVGEFELVIQPVSTCYVPDVRRVYAEVARIAAPDADYISQHKQPVSMQADVVPATRGYEVVTPYFHDGPLPPVTGSLHREEGTLEYLHRWEDLLGGLCRAGFVIEDIDEPRHDAAHSVRGSFAHRSQFIPPYVRVRARRRSDVPRPLRPKDEACNASQEEPPRLERRIWLP